MMDHNQITIMVLTILSAFLLPISFLSIVQVVKLSRSETKMRLLSSKLYSTVVALQNEVASKSLLLAVKPSHTLIDSKTKDLLKLATGNANANEAQAAALQVCKRLARIVNSN